MCDVINSVGYWIETGTNAIALAALAVAIVTVYVTLRMGQQTLDRMEEQFDEERKERQDQAIAEQQYAIFLKVDDLFWYYITRQMNDKLVNEGLPLLPNAWPNPRSSHLEIMRLLNRPTEIKKSEVTFMLSHLKNVLLLPTDKALREILIVHQDLRSKLNPEVAEAFDELNKQEMKIQQDALTTKSITPNSN